MLPFCCLILSDKKNIMSDIQYFTEEGLKKLKMN